MATTATNLNKKNRKKRSSPGFERVAELYAEDIGTAGVKFQNADTTNFPNSQLTSFKVPMSSMEKKRRLAREARFNKLPNPNNTMGQSQAPINPLCVYSASQRKPKKNRSKASSRLVGENRNLEKCYLRLTTFPRKQDVRPLDVLRQALAHIKAKYIQEEDFGWANEQLKSLRQDMTVQRIRNYFVLSVYETHARILLEHGDLNEFNQCQTMLRSLTDGNRAGRDSELNDILFETDDEGDFHFISLAQSRKTADEFRAYALLYALVQRCWSTLKVDLVRAKASMRDLEAEELESASRHALRVVTAVNTHDYRFFFRLYEVAPNMSACLMDFLVKRVRDHAYQRIVAAHRPCVSVEQFREWMVFSDLEETRQYLNERGAIYVYEQGEAPIWVDCKQSMVGNEWIKA